MPALILLFRNNEMIQIKADEMPIGIYYNEKPSFTNHIIQIQENDIIYLFTDGYPDQFGGKRKRKFMIKKFRKLLHDIHHEELHIQRQILENTLDEWQGDYRQLDDILVMSIKF